MFGSASISFARFVPGAVTLIVTFCVTVSFFVTFVVALVTMPFARTARPSSSRRTRSEQLHLLRSRGEQFAVLLEHVVGGRAREAAAGAVFNLPQAVEELLVHGGRR